MTRSLPALVLVGVAAALALALVIALIWRWISRRRQAPCPAWLGGALESGPIDWIWSARRTIERMDLRPGLRVLEIGPGPGRVLIPVARLVGNEGSAVGIDVQPGMIDRLRANAGVAGVNNLTGIAGDGTAPQVEPSTFDVAFLCATLGEIPDREAALRQCYLALKPEGQLHVTELFPDPHYQTPGVVKRLAASAGFRFIRRSGSWLFYTSTFEKPKDSPPRE